MSADLLQARETTEETALLPVLGAVFRGVGTTPLYALRESFGGTAVLVRDRSDVLGVLSLILRGRVPVISVKCLVFVLRADNQGEGGIIALVALLNPWRTRLGKGRYVLMLMGQFGAGLLYGDGTITPAIWVLGAVEGLRVVAPAWAVVPLDGVGKHGCIGAANRRCWS